MEYWIGLELKVAEPALPDMRSLPRFASYDRYAASIEAAYTILSRLNMHDVQFSQARLGRTLCAARTAHGFITP